MKRAPGLPGKNTNKQLLKLLKRHREVLTRPFLNLRIGYRSLLLILVLIGGSAGLYSFANVLTASASTTACQSSAPYGTDTLPSQTAPALSTGTTQSTAPFYIWVRIKTSSSSSNSVGLQVGSSACYDVGGASLTPNTWTWVNYQDGNTSSVMEQNLVGGEAYSLELFGNQSGISVDQVELLTDPNCTPSGTSNNCTINQPATSTGTSPSSGSPSFSSWVSPVFSNTILPSGAFATLGGTVTLSVLINNPNPTTEVVFNQQGGSIGCPGADGGSSTPPPCTGTVVGTATSGSNGIYSINWDTTQANSALMFGANSANTNICALLVDTANPPSNSTTGGSCVTITLNQSIPSGPGNAGSVGVVTAPASGGTNTSASTSGPSISWASPAANTTVSGTTPVGLLVSDPSNAILGAGFTATPSGSSQSINLGSTSSTSTQGEYVVDWDSTAVANGNYVITGSASDTAGLSSSISEDITVSNGSANATPAVTCNGPTTSPSNLTASVASAHQINLQWLAGAAGPNCQLAGYNIYRTGGTGSVTLGSAGTNTSYNDTTVNGGTAYSYQVSAFDNSPNGHESTKSNSASATTPQTCGSSTQLPSTPTLSETSVSYSSIGLQWTPSKVTAPNCQLAGYHLYRNGTLLTNAGTSSSSTAYTNTNLKSGTSYNYTIVAYDNGGNTSATGGPTSVTTATDNVAPTQPSSFTARATGATTVLLAWRASTDLPNPGAVGLSGYKIYRDDGATPIAIINSPATSYTDTSLTAATAYKYTIIAYDKNNNASAPLTDVSVTTQAAPSTTCSGNPTAPNRLTPTAQALTSVSFSWHASTVAANCTLSGYQVSRGGATPQFVTSGTTFTDTGLTPNTSYTYTVTAMDTSGHTSTNNPSLTIKTIADTTAPSAPSNVMDSALGPTQVELSWNASTDNVAVTGYNIYRDGSATPYKTVTNATSYLDTGVAAGTGYTYQVSAIDAAGNESAKTTAQPSPVTTQKATDAQAPTTPGGLKAVVTTSSSVALGWSASTDNVAVTGYNIYRNGTQVGTSSTPSYTDNNLAAKTTYSYTVKAYDAVGNLSAASGALSVTTQSSRSSSSGSSPFLNWFFNYFGIDGAPPAQVANQANVQLSAPVTVEPATVQEQGVKQIAYYLDDKLVGTATVAPFAYELNTTNMLNGQYTLTAKTLYASGTTGSVTQHLTLANAWSRTQAGLFSRHYLLAPLLAIIALLAIWVVARQLMSESMRGGWLGGILVPADADESETTIVRPTRKVGKTKKDS